MELPCRRLGARSNALKTILAMGYVLDREVGKGTDAAGMTMIETRGINHRIELRVDHINNQPKISHGTAPSSVKVGTKITIEWPPKLNVFDWAEDRLKELAESYVWFNPHLILHGVWNGNEFVNVSATNPSWEKMATTESNQPAWLEIATSSGTARCGSSSPSFGDGGTLEVHAVSALSLAIKARRK